MIKLKLNLINFFLLLFIYSNLTINIENYECGLKFNSIFNNLETDEQEDFTDLFYLIKSFKQNFLLVSNLYLRKLNVINNQFEAITLTQNETDFKNKLGLAEREWIYLDKVVSNFTDKHVKLRKILNKMLRIRSNTTHQEIIKIKKRITGGKKAKINNFPWLVSIQIHTVGHFCGGSILNEHWIITASHCLLNVETNGILNESIFISAGHIKWTDGDLYEIDQIHMHENFNTETFVNDIALLKTKKPIQFKNCTHENKCISPICLIQFKKEVNGKASIAGWGITNENLNKPVKYLQTTDLDILENENCEKVYENFEKERMICSGYMEGGKDSCRGDSGGPLQMISEDNRVYLIGIVSFGDMCGQAGYPGVYTKVSNYINWIENIIYKKD